VGSDSRVFKGRRATPDDALVRVLWCKSMMNSNIGVVTADAIIALSYRKHAWFGTPSLRMNVF
jgi:hypothetical protein